MIFAHLGLFTLNCASAVLMLCNKRANCFVSFLIFVCDKCAPMKGKGQGKNVFVCFKIAGYLIKVLGKCRF